MIERLFKRLEPLIRWVVQFPFRVLLISVTTALAGFLLAANLKIDNDLSKLIPRDYPSVQALNTLREQVGSENELAVAIESPSFEANKAFAEDLIPRALNMVNAKTSEPWFNRAEFKKDVSFIEQNALYFATGRELDLLQDYLTDRIEQAKMEANPFYFELDEEETETDSLGEELQQMYDELIGSEYPVSEDSTAMAVRFYPTGSQADLGFIREVYAVLQQEVDALNPASYHPQMEITLAGRLLRTLIEIETITEDVKDSFGAGVLMLLGVVVLYFFYKSYRITAGLHFNRRVLGQEIIRIPFIVVSMGLPLALSLCWTFGIAYLAFGNLNIMTSTLGLLLFGMGIDFGIHFFARYSEERDKGSSIEEAAITTFMTTGQAVTVVGITTSAAFFILTLADFKGFSEFGFIAGIGILFAIIAYVVFLPALLTLLERKNLLNLNRLNLEVETVPQSKDDEKQIPLGSTQKSMAITILLLGIGLTAFSVYHIPQLSFEYRFSNLEPEYKRYTSLNSHVRKVYSDRGTRNAAYIITDTPQDAVAAASVLRHRAATDTLNPTIDRVETFQDRYPMNDSLAVIKLNHIDDIRKLLNDPFLSGQNDEQLERLRRAASTREKIPLDQVPDFIKSPFTSKSGDIGNMVIIYPSVGLADGRNSMNFSDDVSEISLENGKIYYAGSTSIVASDMLRLMIEEAPTMVLLTITVIIVFKLLILGRVRWVLLALVPLAASFVWMFGLMEAFGWKLNFYNLVVLPTVLGIGDDSGIHMVHRYLEEGRGSMRKVLRSTGEHITVSSMTSAVGFGGLLFSIHPGMASIGELAILGILLTLGAALFLVPAIVNLWEKFQERTPKKMDENKKSPEPAHK